MTRCSWAACSEPAVATVQGWAMCSPHRRDHYALEAEAARAQCVSCFLPFTPARARVRRCDACRAAAARASQRSDAGKRKAPDSAIRRCTGCGEWRYSRTPCDVCDLTRKAVA